MRWTLATACVSLCGSLALSLAACATYSDDLARGQKAFESNQHERALAIFRALEPDTSRLTAEERAHYAYLRGMTDYRIGYRGEARHWLSVASAIEEQQPQSLTAEWKSRLNSTLAELNEEVFAGGVQALSDRKGNAEEPHAEKPSGAKKKPDADYDK